MGIPLFSIPIRAQLSGPSSSWSFSLRTQGDLGGEGPRNQAHTPRDLIPPSIITGDGQFQSPLRWEVVGKNLLAMVVQGPLFLLFTLLLQHRHRLLPQSVGPGGGWEGWGWGWASLTSPSSDPS